MIAIGAVERANPLPVGVYWVDVFEDDWEAFSDWLKRNRDGLFVVRVQQFERIAQSGGLTTEAWPARRWYLFKVTQGDSVMWEGPGFPTIARDEQIRSEDTQEIPEEYYEVDIVPEFAKKIGSGALTGLGTALGFAFAGYLLARWADRNGKVRT